MKRTPPADRAAGASVPPTRRALAPLLALLLCAAPLAVAGLLTLSPAAAVAQPSQAAPSLAFELGATPYAGEPFLLQVVAAGFEPGDPPALSPLEIEGATVRPAGIEQRQHQEIDRRRGRILTHNTYVFRFEVVAPTAGSYAVPSLTATQGALSATTDGGALEVRGVETTDKIDVALILPDRPLWVGERAEVFIDWLQQEGVEASDPSILLPLLTDHARFEVSAEQATSRRQRYLTVTGGAETLRLPIRVADRVVHDGQRMTRYRVALTLRPRRAGVLTVDAPVAQGSLTVGYTRDRIGFRVPQTARFEARGEPQQLEVRPLPAQGRPPSFANAIGRRFAFTAELDRTVVRVGEPLTLSLTLRGGDAPAALSLPSLEAMGLDAARFELPAPDALPPGILVPADERAGLAAGKRFEVPVRLRSDAVRELPALAFSFFDPAAAAYHTLRSDPIALSVRDAVIVDASDVTSARPAAAAQSAPGAPGAPGDTLSLVGVELGLSALAQTLDPAWTTRRALPWTLALHATPLLLLGWLTWRRRTRAGRASRSLTRAARRRLDAALADAVTTPGREAAPALIAALHALAQRLGHPPDGLAALSERLEAAAFNPQRRATPLDAALRDEVRALADRWQAAPTPRRPRPPAALLLLVMTLGAAPPAHAQTPAQDAAPAQAAAPTAGATLEQARAAYQDAIGEQDRSRRVAAFARSETLLAVQVAAHPSSPELLVDWGNAALGAQSLGVATLAYRRALRLDPDNPRALRNLAWIRGSLPDWLQPDADDPTSTLLFWRRLLSPGLALLLGAGCFALAILMIAPWSSSRLRRALRPLALLPAACWLWLSAAALIPPPDAHDVVLLHDDQTLHVADNPDAPPVLDQSLPAGAELTLLETRGDWARVALPHGEEGWLPATSIARVVVD